MRTWQYPFLRRTHLEKKLAGTRSSNALKEVIHVEWNGNLKILLK